MTVQLTPAHHEAIRQWLRQQHPDLAEGQCPRCQRRVMTWGMRLLPFPDPILAPLLLLSCPLCAFVLAFDSVPVGLHWVSAESPADPGSEA